MKPNNITITVSKWKPEYYSATPLAKFQKTLADLAAEVPEEYRDSTEIEFHIEDYYGSPVLYAEVTYTRPETFEEIRARAVKETLDAKADEFRERAVLEHLRKKYNV